MDPTANLAEQLALVGRLSDGIGCHEYTDLASYEADVDRLAELVLALHEWMSKGGFPPQQWSKS